MNQKLKKSLFDKTTIISFIIIFILSLFFSLIFLFSIGTQITGLPLPFYGWGSATGGNFYPVNLIIDLVIYYVIAVAISFLFKRKRRK